MTNLTVLEQTVYAMESTFNNVLTDSTISFKREAEFALQIICKSDYAMGIAAKNPQSVRDAVTNVAAIGISLNPAKRQAYLVPMDGAIQLQISWMGLIEMAVASRSVLWAKAEIVREADLFQLNALDKLPTHTYLPFATDRGPVVGVYCVAKLTGGDYMTEVMSIAQIFEIRDRTSSWKAWIKDNKKCPWATDEDEMTRKTVIKRAFKTWPRTDRMDNAVHYLNTDGGEGLEAIKDAGAEAPGQKPAVAMPQPKAKPQAPAQAPAGDVEDVTPKGEGQKPDGGARASVGELAYIKKKIATKGWEHEAVMHAAGMSPTDTLESLTAEGFHLLKAALS